MLFKLKRKNLILVLIIIRDSYRNGFEVMFSTYFDFGVLFLKMSFNVRYYEVCY